MSIINIATKYFFKIVIFGNPSVGKTSLTKRFAKGLFSSSFKKTIGVEFERKKIIIDKVDYTLQIWDFSGEKRFDTLFPLYLRGTVGAIFLFDITNPQSFLDLNRWLKLVYECLPSEYAKKNELKATFEGITYGFKQDHLSIPIIIVASKIDLLEVFSSQYNTFPFLFREVVREICTQRGFSYYETSAKENKHIEELFYHIAIKIHAIRQKPNI